MTTEFWIQMIIYGVTVGIFVGTTRATFSDIKKDIKRLEEKQDKHNGIVEKLTRLEAEHKILHKEYQGGE